jgi:ornithine decarboxylase
VISTKLGQILGKILEESTMQTRAIFRNPVEALAQSQPDVPMLFLSPKTLQDNARSFQAGFPGLVSYAVKANPHPTVLQNLVMAGLDTFDVASPAEIDAVRTACPQAVLHYNNPVRSEAEVASGVAAGVASWSVDEASELAKLADAPRNEVAIRFKLPVAGAAYDFGAKFGATPDAAVELLRQAASMGFQPALCFHPGTQCTDSDAWVSYIHEAARIAGHAGLRIGRLNVGGGFAQDRGQGDPAHEATFSAIDAALAAFGNGRPKLVCEPGRGLVADAAVLAVRVKSRRDDVLYLNDGIYGGLTELDVMGPSGLITVVNSAGKRLSGKTKTFAAFGPTCDSLDTLPDGLELPGDIASGDYILIGGMGAYSNAISTRFNGYGLRDFQTVASLSGQCA